MSHAYLHQGSLRESMKTLEHIQNKKEYSLPRVWFIG